MTKREVAVLACKVLAIYALLDAIKYAGYYLFQPLPFMFAEGLDYVKALAWSVGLLSPLIEIAIGLWLWNKAGVVAAWMTGHDLQDNQYEPDAKPVRADLVAVQAVVFASLGVWALIGVVPHLISHVGWLIYDVASRTGSFGETLRSYSHGDALADVVTIAIGLWLIFDGSGLAQLLTRLRYAGLQPVEREGDARDDSTRAGN